jgi:hypothetical protein
MRTEKTGLENRVRALGRPGRPARSLSIGAAILLVAMTQARAGASPVYQPEPTTATSVGEAGPPRPIRLVFGFGAATLTLPRCSRVVGGGRRCHQSVIRPFAMRPVTRTVPCCHGVVVGGRLLDRAGVPLPDETITVTETFARGAHPGRRVTSVTSGARGYFHDRLAPGPSRQVVAEFSGTESLAPALAPRLRLRVRASVRMRASVARVRVGGAPVIFAGQVAHPDAAVPPTGIPVELEFRLPGKPWTPFRIVQADQAGRFKYPYTFEDDDSAGVRFLFRALVPATGGWAFAPATSPVRSVTG